jgi:hypothetical protein
MSEQRTYQPDHGGIPLKRWGRLELDVTRWCARRRGEATMHRRCASRCSPWARLRSRSPACELLQRASTPIFHAFHGPESALRRKRRAGCSKFTL